VRIFSKIMMGLNLAAVIIALCLAAKIVSDIVAFNDIIRPLGRFRPAMEKPVALLMLVPIACAFINYRMVRKYVRDEKPAGPLEFAANLLLVFQVIYLVATDFPVLLIVVILASYPAINAIYAGLTRRQAASAQIRS